MTCALTLITLELVELGTARERFDAELEVFERDENGVNWRTQRRASLPASGADRNRFGYRGGNATRGDIQMDPVWADGQD